MSNRSGAPTLTRLARTAIAALLLWAAASAFASPARASTSAEIPGLVKTWSFAYVFIYPRGEPLNTWSLGHLDRKRLEFPARLLTATRGLGAARVSPQTFVMDLPPEIMRLESYIWVIDNSALVSAFYDRFPDDFDYLVFGTPPGGIGGGTAQAGYHWDIRTPTTGVRPASEPFPAALHPEAARSSRVLGLSVMSIDIFTANDAGRVELHEFMHQFCCYIALPGDPGPGRLPFLGIVTRRGPSPLTDGQGHWTNWFSGGSDVLASYEGCCQITDNGNGSYTWQERPAAYVLSDLELYLAGLIPASAVQPMTLTTPDPMPSCRCLLEHFASQPPAQHVFSAKRTTLRIEDIVKANGPRIDIPVSALRIVEASPRQLVQVGYHSRWLTQSDYPVMRPGEVRTFWIVFRNTGTAPWVRGVWGRQVNLGLNGDDRTPYALGMADSWLWQDRIATTIQDVVDPGQLGVFAFRLRAPLRVGDYSLNLRPVADGTVWLEDEGVFWTILVR